MINVEDHAAHCPMAREIIFFFNEGDFPHVKNPKKYSPPDPQALEPPVCWWHVDPCIRPVPGERGSVMRLRLGRLGRRLVKLFTFISPMDHELDSNAPQQPTPFKNVRDDCFHCVKRGGGVVTNCFSPKKEVGWGGRVATNYY